MITVGNRYPSKRKCAGFSVTGWALSRVGKNNPGSCLNQKEIQIYRQKPIHNSPSLPTDNTDVEILSCNADYVITLVCRL